jgi:phosphoribosylamine--glycine ligase
MNILLLGSGGREHALAWKIAASPLTTKLWCAPGNAGIAQEAECVALDISDHAAVVAFCKANKVDFVVVGPRRRWSPASWTISKPPASRPSARARTRRGSKAPRVHQGLCRAHNIPTGAYERFTAAEPAKVYARKQKHRS